MSPLLRQSDTNALSNFVADGPNVIGFDPFAKLVDWLEVEAGISTKVHPYGLIPVA